MLRATDGKVVSGVPHGQLTGVVIDSRIAAAGSLFVAIPGDRQDGHGFVLDAFDRGAGAALVQDVPTGAPWAQADWGGPPAILVHSTSGGLAALASSWRRRHSVRVVGVTGSVGKTTAKEVIAGLLSQKFQVLRSPANYNTELGLPIAVMDLDASHQVAVLEMGMHDLGEIRQLAEIAQPELGVVMNVFPTHLERLGTIDRIAEAKSELVQSLPLDGLALLNADDERVGAMAAVCPASSLLYGTSPQADLRATDVQPRGLQGVDCTVEFRGARRRVQLQLLGRHSIYPALAAVGTAVHLGMSFDEAAAGLAQVPSGPRLAVTAGTRGETIIDDSYNASPASTLAALDFLQQLEGRRVAVLGDMLELGTFEEEGHRLVGRKVPEAVQWLLTVGPRARLIAEEAQNQGMDRGQIDCCGDCHEAVLRLQGGLCPGDCVLVKGSHAMGLDAVVRALLGQELALPPQEER